MPKDARLNRVMPALSARERAVAAVAAWKEGHPEDPGLRRTLPQGQAPEFGQLIDLVRGVNGRLAWLILVYQEQVRGHWMLLGWISALKAWGHNASILSHAALAQHLELVTESEGEHRREQARSEPLTLREAAGYLAKRVADEDESLEEDEAAFNAEVRNQERRLRIAVKSGQLRPTRGRITQGELWDWLGEETRLWPEWGSRVSVVGDDRGEDVAWQRKWSERTRKALAAAPIRFAEGWEVGEDASQADHCGDFLVNALKAQTARSWREVRALVLCIHEVADRLGDDPMHPECRAGLNALVADMEALANVVGEMLGGVELEEPGEQELAELREVVELAAKA